MDTQRGGGAVPHEAHNLGTLVRIQAPQQANENPAHAGFSFARRGEEGSLRCLRLDPNRRSRIARSEASTIGEPGEEVLNERSEFRNLTLESRPRNKETRAAIRPLAFFVFLVGAGRCRPESTFQAHNCCSTLQ